MAELFTNLYYDLRNSFHTLLEKAKCSETKGTVNNWITNFSGMIIACTELL